MTGSVIEWSVIGPVICCASFVCIRRRQKPGILFAGVIGVVVQGYCAFYIHIYIIIAIYIYVCECMKESVVV